MLLEIARTSYSKRNVLIGSQGVTIPRDLPKNQKRGGHPYAGGDRLSRTLAPLGSCVNTAALGMATAHLKSRTARRGYRIT